MRQRPTARRWWTLLILGLVGVWAEPGARTAAGSTCHAPDRPVLGLDLDGDDPFMDVLRLARPVGDPTGGATSTRAPAPRYRPVPCEADSLPRPDRMPASSPPVGPTPAPTPRRPERLRHAGNDGPARPLDDGGRLERPPRRI